MNPPSESIRVLVKSLLAAEAEAEPVSSGQTHVAVRVCEKLRISLSQFVGADGFTSLLRRSVVLARAQVPSLKNVQVTARGHLEGIEVLAAGVDADGIDAANEITAQMLGLLVDFVGDSLTRRLLRNAWPGMQTDD